MKVKEAKVLNIIAVNYQDKKWKAVTVVYLDAKGNEQAGFGSVSFDYGIKKNDKVMIHERGEKHKVDILEI